MKASKSSGKNFQHQIRALKVYLKARKENKKKHINSIMQQSQLQLFKFAGKLSYEINSIACCLSDDLKEDHRKAGESNFQQTLP